MIDKKYKVPEEEIFTGKEQEFFERGVEKGYFEIIKDGSKIRYRASEETFNLERAEEKARASFLIKLIEKYDYPESSIFLDVKVPGMDKADLVVYKEDTAYIVVECCRSDISESEINKTIQLALAKAKALKADYAILATGFQYFSFDVKGMINNKAKPISDIPKNIGK